MNRTPVADWQQLSALYEVADALDPVSLAAWLAQLRAQSHPLLKQLEQMLMAREQVQRNGFLGASPALPPSSPASMSEPQAVAWAEGSRIGPYRLVRRLGEGGMAEVWMAQRDDGAFQRTVAIKLLFRHAGSSERDSFAQRFARERDILASLDHPHIAALHDAGVTPAGQPWLALEYIEGQTLTLWCDTQRLDIAARVRLFRQVLLAVQHAHANLVIHRDLKPGNILVTAQGEVRLLDFGIAKLMEPEGGALAETELTRLAGRPMTPQYAAPEQLLGQPLTTACDVYALGVVLYELLCGERPYELKLDSAAQLEQSILEVEPRGPSRRALTDAAVQSRGSSTQVALRKTLSSDLDAIVLRALAKQPAQRYGSVEAFRADLDHWLAGEPVEARVPSAAYRVSKFVGRHRWAVALSAGAVLSLIGITVVAVVMGLQAREDSARAGAARDFMLNIFARANQEKSRGADITARDLLETGRKDVLTRLAGQPKLQAELLRGIAKIQSDMGEYVTADSTFAELARIFAELGQPREESMARADHAFNALQLNNLELAKRLLISAQSVRRRPTTDPELNARLAEVAGLLTLNGGDAPGAASVLSDAREAALRSLGREHLRTFRLTQHLARVDVERGDLGAALTLQQELSEVAGRVQGLSADDIVGIDWERVALLLKAGRVAQALAIIKVALPSCARALGPSNQTCRFLLLYEGEALLKGGHVSQAMSLVPQLQSMELDTTLPFLQVGSMVLELRLRSFEKESHDLDALFERVRQFGQSGVEVGMTSTFKAAALLALAECRLRARDFDQARDWARKTLSTLGDKANEGQGLQAAAIARMLTGIAFREQGRLDEALEWLERSRADSGRAVGSEHPTTQLFALNVAATLAELRRTSEAAAMAKHAEAVLRDTLGLDSPTYEKALALVQTLEGTRPPAAVKGSPSKTEFFR